MADSTIYDAMPYRSFARAASYVGHLAVLGRLLGMGVAPPEHCRVLELGAGDGGNLIPMALSLPDSEFVGVDLAPTVVERGMAAAAAAGVTNITLRQGDIAKLGAELGEFDYVIAHGVFSWVPPAVRTALLQLVRERMRPQGLAFVSYNALPGDHMRGMLRQMMRMHTAGIEDPRKKLEQARALLHMLAQAPGDAGDVYRPLLQSDVGRALQGSDDLLFHDYLADISQPFFFSQFMGAATAAGLQFASEAVFHSMSVQALPDEVATMLGDLAERDIIAKEQYLDFVTCRAFRQTVLCHEEVQLRPDVDRERLEQFRFFSEAVRQEPEPGRDGVSFRHRNGSALRTDHPLALAAFDRLLAAQPRSVPFADLATDVGATTVEDRELLASVLFEAFSVGVIGMRLVEPQIVLELSERPTASAWARHLAPTGQATNLYHEVVELDDPARRLLPLADGSRPLTRLARDAGLEEADAVATLRRLATLGLLVG